MIEDKRADLIRKGLLLLIPFLLYGATLTFDYALDDALYITDNSFTKEGIAGIWDHLTKESLVGFYGEQKSLLTGGRYRPLAPITYSIEYALYGFNPSLSHLLNVLLYGVLLLLLYQVLMRFCSLKHWFLNVAFLGLLFFAVHPLHVEVVANIKGRDQILGLMAVAGATLISFRFFEGNRLSLVWMGLVFFLGLLAKESTITFLPIIPLLHYFFKEKRIKETLPVLLALIVPAVLWFALRSWALQGFESVESTTLLNDPYMNSTGGQKLGTTVYTWLLYLKLLVVPHPLTYDYYPFHIAIREFADIRVILSLVVHLFLVGMAFVGFRKRSVYAFLIIFYAATFSISSNLFFNIGIFMNERFMFEPSLAFCVLMGLLIVKKVPVKLRWLVALVPLICFAGLSINRSFAWKDNYTLFTTDVKTSGNSIKGLMAGGGMLMERAITLPDSPEKTALLNQSVEYLEKGIRLLPSELNNYRLLGQAYLERDGINQESLNAYKEVFNQNPGDSYTIRNVEIIVSDQRYPAQNRLNFGLNFVQDMPASGILHFQLGTIYGQTLGDMTNSLLYLKRAVEISPDNLDYLKNYGTALAISGDYQGSVDYFLQAINLSPNDKQALSGLALSYQNLGQLEEAQYYRSLANQ